MSDSLSATVGVALDTLQKQEQVAKKKNTFFNDGETRIWTLYYMYGSSSPISKLFTFDGNLQDATVRGRKHCSIMRYKFVRVRPALVDLDHQEEQFIRGAYKDPDALEV